MTHPSKSFLSGFSGCFGVGCAVVGVGAFVLLMFFVAALIVMWM